MLRALGIVTFGGVIVVACNTITGAYEFTYADDIHDASLRDTAAVPTCNDTGLCLPNADGWTPVVMPATDAGCPSDFPDSTVVQIPGAGGCTCSCSATSGSCSGKIGANYGAGCGTESDYHGIPGTGACTNGTTDAPVPLALRPLPISPVTACSGAGGPSALTRPTAAVVCAGASVAETCPSGQACVPRFQGSKAGNCIGHDGEQPCPAAFPLRLVVASAIVDERRCPTSCSCVPDGCVGGKVEFYDVAGCPPANLRRTQNTDGACVTDAPVVSQVRSMRYFAPLGCAVERTPQPIGEQELTAPRTICCLGNGS